MNLLKKKFPLFILLFISNNILFAQDSLYLVGTLQGKYVGNEHGGFNEKRIFNISKVGDINGDGYDDFITTFPEENYCNVYLGGNSLDLKPDYIIYNPYNVYDFGLFLGNVGDVNKDGYDDFVIQGKFKTKYYVGKIFLYLGGEDFNTEPDFSFREYFVQDALGASISGGDVNGDGYSDFVIGNPYNWDNARGRVYLFLGGETIIDTPYVTFLSDSLEDFYGGNVSLDSDIDGDGFNDLLINAPYVAGCCSASIIPKSYVYYGGNSISNHYDYKFDIDFSERIKIVGDVNNDGYDDFIFSEGVINPRLYFGSTNFTANNFLEFSAYNRNDDFGFGSGGIGDINNDGYSDFAINIKNFINDKNIMVSKLNIYLGGGVVDTIPDFLLEGETKWGEFGKQVGNLGDLNGDGYNEFYVFSPLYPNSDKPLGKIYIYSMKNFIVGVEEKQEKIPIDFKLNQNYPNPFNPTTTISFNLPKTSKIQLDVYNILGEKVAALLNKTMNAGKHRIKFNASELNSGVYFYKISTGNCVKIKKMAVIK